MKTMKDIARIAGVSQSTVSRSLNNSSLISEETKTRIKMIAEQHGFEFNANARNLSTNKTNTIAVIFSETYKTFDKSFYYSFLHNQIRNILEPQEFDIILTFPFNHYTGKSNIQSLVNQKKVDGIIIVNSELKKKEYDFLESSKVAHVYLHFLPEIIKEKSIDCIYVDHYKGGFIATEHLINLGHKKIVSISSTRKYGDEYFLREKGYKEALKKYGIEYNKDIMFYGDGSFKSSYNLVCENLKIIREADAIFVHTDLMALGVLEALREKGIEVPDEIAVVGYDNIELATYFKPYLTTIHQPREEMIEIACDRLVKLIKTKNRYPRERVIINPKLIIRDSCGSNLKASY